MSIELIIRTFNVHPARLCPHNSFWSLATDALTPQQATELGEDLGIELDTPEHGTLERGVLCAAGSVLGKRRR